MLDEKSVIPLYYQLKEILKEQINDGSLKEGEMVPSERELMEIYNISRATARKALSDLMIEGLIVRKQGVGTFVSPKKVLQDLNGEIAFSRQVYEQGLTPSTKVIKAAIENEVPNRILKKFNLHKTDKIFKIFAVASVNNDPIILATTYVPLEVAPNIQEKNLENTVFYEFLENEHNVEITHSTLEIDPMIVNEFEADHLNTTIVKPALSIERVYYYNEKAVVVEERVALGEKCKYLFTLKHGSTENKDYSLRTKVNKEVLKGE